MKPKVWTEVMLHPEALARLQAHAEVIRGTLGDVAGAEAAIIGGSSVDRAFIERAGPSLKLVIRHGIGYNTLDVPTATHYGVLSANTPDAPTESTAEQAVGLLLAVAKAIVKSDMMLRANLRVTSAELRGVEVRDRVLGVVGYGRIGRRVTEICALGLKMPVVVFDPYLSPIASLPEGVTMADSLDALLPQVDFLTLHTPLMPETHHLIGERQVRLMKRGSFLINVSRGAVVDEAALIRALQDEHLAGAGLDVFDPEPPMPDNPLLRMTNVVVTPHVASNTDKGYWRMSQSVVDQVLQVLAGEPPSFLIDPAAWPGRVGTPLSRVH
ncbi:MAG TPA: hydroxyacid dehydrogenase [Herpetosiphonaceae bacterium]|nr:hydroxyacid dehydrogenase [Herpetosiphonaceae bacterium]